MRRAPVRHDVAEVGVVERPVVGEDQLRNARHVHRKESEQALWSLRHLLQAAGAKFARGHVGLEKDFKQQVAGDRAVLDVPP
jgi:hypothetical protein